MDINFLPENKKTKKEKDGYDIVWSTPDSNSVIKRKSFLNFEIIKKIWLNYRNFFKQKRVDFIREKTRQEKNKLKLSVDSPSFKNTTNGELKKNERPIFVKTAKTFVDKPVLVVQNTNAKSVNSINVKRDSSEQFVPQNREKIENFFSVKQSEKPAIKPFDQKARFQALVEKKAATASPIIPSPQITKNESDNFLKATLAEAKLEGFVRPEFKPVSAQEPKVIKRRQENSVFLVWKKIKEFFLKINFNRKEKVGNPKENEKNSKKIVEQTTVSAFDGPRVLESNLIKKDPGNNKLLERNLLALSFLVVPVLFLFLVNFVINQTQKRINLELEVVNRDIANFSKDVSDIKNGSQAAIQFQKKVANINNLLNKHVYWTNFFEYLEKNTLSEVFYKGGFSGSLDYQYSLKASTANFTLAEKQVIQFLSDSLTQTASIEKAAVVGGGQSANKNVDFDIKLSVKPALFLK
jgi:hypothetical protein